MSMINCPECGKQISDRAGNCPNCGYPLSNQSTLQTAQQKLKNNALLDVLIALSLVIIPIAPIGIILMWVKKFPQKKSIRILATVIFGIFFLFWALISCGSNNDNAPKKVESTSTNSVQTSNDVIQNTAKTAEEQNIGNKDVAAVQAEDKETETSTTLEGENVTENTIFEGEILFKEIPWGSSFPSVDEKLGTWELWNISDEALKECSVDEILLGDYKGIDFEYGGINVISSAFNGEQEVAGYNTSEITLYFSYLPVGDYLSYDEKDTALYGAQYKFTPVNLQDMYEDLKQKLADIYGEPAKVTEDSDLWENKYTYTYWYGANDTELVLRSLNSENDTTDLYSDEIYITYAWRNGDTLLQNASNAVKKEKAEKEKAAQGIENTEGL